MIAIGVAIGLTWVEHALAGLLPAASLPGVMAIGFVLLEQAASVAHLISRRLKSVWVFAERRLFVRVGVQVAVQAALEAGLACGCWPARFGIQWCATDFFRLFRGKPP